MLAILHTEASKHRTRQVRALLRAYGLNPWHLHTSRLRTSWQPYHNYQHCYQVALDGVEGAAAVGLSDQQAKVVFIAALYHDHHHTADFRVTDQVNIRRALRAARFWLRLLSKNLTRTEQQRAAWLIAMTENSHSTKSNMLEVDVIRDADLLTTTGQDRHLFQQMLALEQNIPVNDAGTIGFLTAHPLTTEWGQSRVEAFKRAVTENVVK